MTDTPTHLREADAAIREEIHALSGKVDKIDRRNQDDHQAIMSQMLELVSDRKALRLVGILIGISLGSVTGAAAYFVSRLDSAETHIQQVQAEERANAKYGFELANGLRRDVDKNELRILQLDTAHQNEHRIGPAKEK